MRVLVCGGREYADRTTLFERLTEIHRDNRVSLLINGGTNGADMMAHVWAMNSRIPSKTYYADWKTHGRTAGPIRNQRMLDEGRPDLVIAFPGGRGTRDMVTRAKAAGVRVIEV